MHLHIDNISVTTKNISIQWPFAKCVLTCLTAASAHLCRRLSIATLRRGRSYSSDVLSSSKADARSSLFSGGIAHVRVNRINQHLECTVTAVQQLQIAIKQGIHGSNRRNNMEAHEREGREHLCIRNVQPDGRKGSFAHALAAPKHC